jgi:hypothetical protein
MAASIAANAWSMVATKRPDGAERSRFSPTETRATPWESASFAQAFSVGDVAGDAVDLGEDQYVRGGPPCAHLEQSGTVKSEALVRGGDVEVVDDVDHVPAVRCAVRPADLLLSFR